MKIGIFDSGLGGLIIAHALIKQMGQYDYLYLGDTKNLPYGEKPKNIIYELTKKGLDYLFKNDCKLVILACNSASSDALRKIQQEYIPSNWPDRKALGVLIPTAEVATENGKHIGLLCTNATANSMAFDREIGKLSKTVKLTTQPAPELVEHIENGDIDSATKNLDSYLTEMSEKGVDTLVLGCTHFPVVKKQARAMLGDGVNVISQDEIIPDKLKDYLSRHQEIEKDLSHAPSARFLVTKNNDSNASFANMLFDSTLQIEYVKI